MLRFLVFLALAAGAWQYFSASPAVSLPAGVMVPEAPMQKKLVGKDQAMPYSFKGYEVTPLASFALKAKVLDKEKYSFDRGADLSPIDLALGWQKMSDQEVVDQITFSQSNRWYRWQVDNFPVPRKEIETQSANMHLIPRDNSVRRQLARVRVGQIIQLSGQLVSIKGEDGFRWNSSLTRDDVGANACELFMVDSIDVLKTT